MGGGGRTSSFAPSHSLNTSTPFLLGSALASALFACLASHTAVSLSAVAAVASVVLCISAGLRWVVGDPLRDTAAHGFGPRCTALAAAATPAAPKLDNNGSCDSGEPPADLSQEELLLLQYFFAITFRLGDDEAAISSIWCMTGGGKPLPSAPDQLNFTAIRYHLSFVAYATAAICMRTPLLKAQGGAVLGWVMRQLLSPRVFRYCDFYWPADGSAS